MATTIVYPPDAAFELEPFLTRVLDIVRLFEHASVVRLRVYGTIAAGEPIEALETEETVEIQGPVALARRRQAALRRCLCGVLERGTADVFELARVLTPVLAALKLAGGAPAEVDLDPWLFAGAALLVARVGVAAFCAGKENDVDGGEQDDAPGGDAEADAPPPTSVTPRG